MRFDELVDWRRECRTEGRVWIKYSNVDSIERSVDIDEQRNREGVTTASELQPTAITSEEEALNKLFGRVAQGDLSEL